MDVLQIAKEAGNMGLHTILIFLIYVLWRRQGKLENMLYDCVQSGGKVDPKELDELQKL